MANKGLGEKTPYWEELHLDYTKKYTKRDVRDDERAMLDNPDEYKFQPNTDRMISPYKKGIRL